MPFVEDSKDINNQEERYEQDSTIKQNQSMSKAQLEYLKSIDSSVKQILTLGQEMSQSAARDMMPRFSDFTGGNQSTYKNTRNFRSSRIRSGRSGSSNIAGQFLDSFEDAILEGFLGADFKDKVKTSVTMFADMLGTDIENLGKTVGDELGKEVVNKIRASKTGQRFENTAKDKFGKAKDAGIDAFKEYVGMDDIQWDTFFKNAKSKVAGAKMGKAAAGASSASKTASSAMSTGLQMVDKVDDIGKAVNTAKTVGSTTKAAMSATKALGGLKAAGGAFAKSLLTGNVALIAVTAALVALPLILNALENAMKPAIEGFKKFSEEAKRAANRTHESEDKRAENAQERLRQDVETIVREPFEILKDAAQKVYDVWDTQLRMINQTQGYTKEDLQSLMGSYADRLRREGLTSVVSGADITENLSKVLQSGLSGSVAEEFAYIATILQAAIPSQDFFSYADTYASLAATAIQNGKSETEAIQYANEQLTLFASNILYASRQISGGFTTGLQDAEKLFEQSVRIAQTGRTSNVAGISGVMTSIAAIVGSVAPDLATSMTDLVYQAATGGNSSQIVALRSLAGINASNTEFLRKVATNPQAVFTELFNNLAQMQNMSNDAYMEVAEGLSEVFGVSMDAFARIDFNYLADAISNMSVSNASLSENLDLLKSGESTTSAEQMRMQQINQYMLDEGLAYVMDNQAARAIQQHMWDEQIANELMEATYGVELTGAALEFLKGIKQTVENVLGFLNPFSWIKKATSLVATAVESAGTQSDIAQVLQLGKVGTGNLQDLYNLTTRGRDLNLTPNLVTLMGGVSAYNLASIMRKSQEYLSHPLSFNSDLLNGMLLSDIKAYDARRTSSGPSSRYTWGTVGKSTANLLGSVSGTPSGTTIQAVAQSGTVSAKAASQNKLEKMLSEDYIQSFVDKNMSYEDWAATAKNFGIADLNKAMEEAGYNEQDVRNYFQTMETKAGAEREIQRQSKEETFWDKMQEYSAELVELTTYNNKVLDDIYKKNTEWYDAWVDYFVNHTAYFNSYNHEDVEKVRLAEKGESQDAVYALAEALTQNSTELLDPTLQTNALLSQILIVVNAIMQQNNQAGSGLSLPDTLSGLALGIVKQT